MKSEIIKIIHQPPYSDGDRIIKNLRDTGWEVEVVNDSEIISHGTQANDFVHKYQWTLICNRSDG